jgi:hypothetical protein
MNPDIKNKPSVMLARSVSIFLLFLLGITALFGGSALIIDPSGQSLGMSQEQLSGTIFTDYLLPGIILFLALGVLSNAAAILSLGNYRSYPLLVLYQGVILTIWIMVQIYLLPDMHLLQLVYGFIGLLLILLGNYLRLKAQSRNMKVIY